MKTNNITLFSSFAKDRLYDQNNTFLGEQLGGPAYYIVKALREENIQTIVPQSLWFTVDIMVTNNGEFGKVRIAPKSIDIPWSSITSPMVYISTILNEFLLNSINLYKGKVFLDIQGYVRNGNTYGTKKICEYSQKTLQNVYCLKGTKEEISYIPKDAIKRQKRKLLLITDGSKGSVVYANNKKYMITPSTILKRTDTIGAGDTLFAFFIACMSKNWSPQKALLYATGKTERFLQNKCFKTKNLIEQLNK
jgi:hypothetical protein